MDNSDTTKNSIDWVVSQSLSKESIDSYCKEILTDPTYMLSTDSEKEKEPLYSIEQMREMFKEGFLMMSKSELGQRILNAKAVKLPKAYSRIRNLEVGERALFPYRQWGAVRAGASQLKREFGCLFITRKTTFSGEIGDIEVVRIK